jgi:hypothetical protein
MWVTPMMRASSGMRSTICSIERPQRRNVPTGLGMSVSWSMPSPAESMTDTWCPASRSTAAM